mmetsp:Transcript_2477/g.3793  ORF Transcript_2477/g.3793 Transcript_2477/m.3793 type:complete len:90 (+) Transcript_2477:227-496(+)
MIAPECLQSISLTSLLEVGSMITEIMPNHELRRKQKLHRVHALITYQALLEVSSILELAIWKDEVDKIDDLNPRTRLETGVERGGKPKV